MYATQYPELISLTHPNTQLDNALYYYKDEACTQMEALIIDWAAVGGFPFFTTMGSNLLSGAEPKMLEDHLSDLCKMWVDTYRAEGGSSRIDFTLCETIIKLSMCGACLGLAGFLRVIQNNVKYESKKWLEFRDRWDPQINDYYVRRAAIAQMNHAFECWMSRKLRLYDTFTEWLRENSDLVISKPRLTAELPGPPAKMHTQ